MSFYLFIEILCIKMSSVYWALATTTTTYMTIMAILRNLITKRITIFFHYTSKMTKYGTLEKQQFSAL